MHPLSLLMAHPVSAQAAAQMAATKRNQSISNLPMLLQAIEFFA
jgi:hypothetical protein